MKRAVIIVAAGRGQRMKSSIPKQFMMLGGIPILCRTILRFVEFDPQITIFLVLSSSYISSWLQISSNFIKPETCKIIQGGNERFYSVKNAVAKLSTDIDLVAVHDGVRPLVSHTCIANCFAQASILGNAVPYVDVCESIRYVNNVVNKHIDRKHIKIVQTPQVFQTSILTEAYQSNYFPEFTDDASVVQKTSGQKINLVKGEKTNIKITDIDDFKYAEYLIEKKIV